jgi:hypothetical protein
MNDLNTIARLNAERFGDKIAEARRNGKHILAYYVGLSLVRFTTHDTEGEVRAIANSEDLPITERREYHAPTLTREALVRDQSEDRTLADVVSRAEAAVKLEDSENTVD